MKVAVIGRGAIGAPVAAALAGGQVPGAELLGVLHRGASDGDLLRRADLVVGCAGQEALAELGPPVRRAANVAASVALAVRSWRNVEAALIADPAAELTSHVITATGTPGSYRFEINNRPDEHPPTTSAVVPFAVLRSIGSLAGERLVLR